MLRGAREMDRQIDKAAKTDRKNRPLSVLRESYWTAYGDRAAFRVGILKNSNKTGPERQPMPLRAAKQLKIDARAACFARIRH